MATAPQLLEPRQRSKPGDLAVVLLARDSYEPLILEQSTGAVDGYAEGAMLNTRFGSFPHSTLLDIPWGSQVRASAVDTGSRGRKRRREDSGDDASTPALEDTEGTATPTSAPAKKAVSASSGFIHILRPSPELWTYSLPHRTQVVYTPDYSYILNRIRARPGTRIIEAGAGSGSFTHASVRAVYNGAPKSEDDRKGKVFSFEFNEARFRKMEEEVDSHCLRDFVSIKHRDVYNEGFLVDGKSPMASAVFLDLPAPWKAIRHLSRRRPQDMEQDASDDSKWVSALDPKKTAMICTFSPCIEQVIQTVSDLRKLGWVEVDMVEVSNRRLVSQRDRIGSYLPKEKGANPNPADVTEALSKLREVNQKTREFTRIKANGREGGQDDQMDVDGSNSEREPNANNKLDESSTEKSWMQGRLVHRPEAELKSHTSYLVFATLPPEWSEEDEAAAYAKWPCGNEAKVVGSLDKAARKQEKRDALHSKKKRKQDQADGEAQ
ncbi:unnamed protein product [Clonostachys rosea]|uniref:tRNA (adenine(58)-N(1))-methyltransferase catalytic subunit TRM61 n=1 Tax=Bionectria ochroleuca TaxID=29856 RepID=A0ABY6U0T6_BIOOC|nr:unnamed protein product [Clonostachys rosea]